jgi:hypothetical protein
MGTKVGYQRLTNRPEIPCHLTAPRPATPDDRLSVLHSLRGNANVVAAAVVRRRIRPLEGGTKRDASIQMVCGSLRPRDPMRSSRGPGVASLVKQAPGIKENWRLGRKGRGTPLVLGALRTCLKQHMFRIVLAFVSSRRGWELNLGTNKSSDVRRSRFTFLLAPSTAHEVRLASVTSLVFFASFVSCAYLFSGLASLAS